MNTPLLLTMSAMLLAVAVQGTPLAIPKAIAEEDVGGKPPAFDEDSGTSSKYAVMENSTSDSEPDAWTTGAVGSSFAASNETSGGSPTANDIGDLSTSDIAVEAISAESSSDEDEEEEEFSESQKVRIEEFKSAVLKQLKLPQAPEVDSLRIPDDVIAKVEDEEAFAEDVESVVVKPELGDEQCRRSKWPLCRRLRFKMDVDAEEVFSVRAWFHKTRRDEAISAAVFHTKRPDDPVIALEEDPLALRDERWTSFELPKLLALETQGKQVTCVIETNDVSSGDRSPFLVLTRASGGPRGRHRRSAGDEDRKSSNCTCCTDQFIVTTKQLNWTWVVRPKEFHIKMCRGECPANQSRNKINYEHIVNMYYKKQQPLPEGCKFWEPVCRPASYLSMPMIYASTNNSFTYTTLHGMLIDRCLCS